MTIHWKAGKHYFAVELFVFQFYSNCNFGKFINFELGMVRSEKVNQTGESKILKLIPQVIPTTYEIVSLFLVLLQTINI